MLYLYLYLLALSLSININPLTSTNIIASTISYQTQQVAPKKKDSRKRSNCYVSSDSCKLK
ncbi:MAG: hypothetical protein QM487_02780 [Candidatus Marithrix sp.]